MTDLGTNVRRQVAALRVKNNQFKVATENMRKQFANDRVRKNRHDRNAAVPRQPKVRTKAPVTTPPSRGSRPSSASSLPKIPSPQGGEAAPPPPKKGGGGAHKCPHCQRGFSKIGHAVSHAGRCAARGGGGGGGGHDDGGSLSDTSEGGTPRARVRRRRPQAGGREGDSLPSVNKAAAAAARRAKSGPRDAAASDFEARYAQWRKQKSVPLEEPFMRSYGPWSERGAKPDGGQENAPGGGGGGGRHGSSGAHPPPPEAYDPASTEKGYTPAGADTAAWEAYQKYKTAHARKEQQQQQQQQQQGGGRPPPPPPRRPDPSIAAGKAADLKEKLQGQVAQSDRLLLQLYDLRWTKFGKALTAASSPQKPIRYKDVPWLPLLNRRDGKTGGELFETIGCGDDAPAADKKLAVRKASLRWHPDKFSQAFGNRIAADERDRVMDGVKLMAQRVLELKRRV